MYPVILAVLISAMDARNPVLSSDNKQTYLLHLSGSDMERCLTYDSEHGRLTGQATRRVSTGAFWQSPNACTPQYHIRIRTEANGPIQELASDQPHAAISLSRQTIREGERLNIVLQRDDIPIECTLQYESFTRHPFIRQYGAIRNTGTQVIYVEDITLFQMELDVAWNKLQAFYGLKRIKTEDSPWWFRLHSFDGSRDQALQFETGRWRFATWLPLWRKDADEGLTIGWESYSPVQCILEPTQDGRAASLRLVMPTAARLEPGSSIAIPAVFTGLHDSDCDTGHFVTHRFAEDRIAWPVPDSNFPYVLFNTWGYGTRVDDALCRKAIALCAELGVEGMVVDFGWEGPDWLPLPETFPNGLAPLSDLCHAQGMKFGIHFSFANISEKAAIYRQHPDWAYGEGCFAYGHEEFPVYRLSFGLPQVRAWTRQMVSEVLKRERADWFLTDTHIWGHIDPEKHVVPADQNYLVGAAYEQLLDEIRSDNPNVLIEHCDGGVSLATYAMMRQHVTSITCDNADALETRLSVYDLSRFLPPRYLDKYQQEWRSRYANRSCMFGGPWILMTPIHTLEPGSKDWRELVEDIQCYKQYRSRIRDGKVLHLVAPGDPADPSWDGWDAIGSYNPSEDAAIVFVFRTCGPLSERIIPMKALKPDGLYSIKWLDTNATREASGAEIMKSGLPCRLDAYMENPESHCSEIIVIEPIKH